MTILAGKPAGDCAVCHDVRAFRPSTWPVAEHQRTKYPLDGAHALAACEKCHTDRVFRDLVLDLGSVGGAVTEFIRISVDPVPRKVFRREILQKITIEENRFGFEPEITAKIAKLDCVIYEVGISYYGRTKLAGERGVTVIEVKEDKLMLTRHNDLVTLGGKFPRLTKKDAKGRLKEIKRLLLAL